MDPVLAIDKIKDFFGHFVGSVGGNLVSPLDSAEDLSTRRSIQHSRSLSLKDLFITIGSNDKCMTGSGGLSDGIEMA